MMNVDFPDGSFEPVTTSEAALAARLDPDHPLTDELEALITSARESAEFITGRCYRLQRRTFGLSRWPSSSQPMPVHGATACVIEYWTGADWSVLDVGAYDFAPGGIGGNGTVVAPRSGMAWPTLGERSIGPRVRVSITAGPESLTAVPAQVKTYIKASVAAWVKSPEAQATGSFSPNPAFERLLDAQKLYG